MAVGEKLDVCVGEELDGGELAGGDEDAEFEGGGLDDAGLEGAGFEGAGLEGAGFEGAGLDGAGPPPLPRCPDPDDDLPDLGEEPDVEWDDEPPEDDERPGVPAGADVGAPVK